MSSKWNEVTREHVLQAISKYDHCGTEGRARNTYLRYANKLYPAKHIRALAYEIAFGQSPDRSTFSGGMETVAFFKKLGFDTVHGTQSIVAPGPEVCDRPPVEVAPDGGTAVSPDRAFDWRSLELDLQRIRLVYLKWLCRYTPRPCAALDACTYNDEVYVIDSPYGRSFSLSPAGRGLAYVGAGKGNVRLPVGSYADDPELLAETARIRESLNARVSQLKQLIRCLIGEGDHRLAWEYIQNYWWLRLGQHEYVYDVCFGPSELPSFDVREYVLATIYNKIDLNDGAVPPFTDAQILTSVRNQFAWDRFGCCSYDCGPIAIGKKGFVPYKLAAAHVRQYSADNADALKSLSTIDEKRDFAVGSLITLYDFPILYHRLGFRTLAGLQSCRDALMEKIREADAYLAGAAMDIEA